METQTSINHQQVMQPLENAEQGEEAASPRRRRESRFRRFIGRRLTHGTQFIQMRPLHMPALPPQVVHMKKYMHFEDCVDVLARIICVMCVILQGAILDYYLIHYNSALWSAWVLTDILGIGFISWSLYTSYIHFLKTRRQGHPEKIERVPAFFSWTVYSIALISRVAIIFKHTAHVLTYNDVLGPNMLKTMIALTAVIYLLFVLSHHDAEPFSPRNTYLSYLSGTVTLDIFDSIAFLDVLFTQESRILLPFSLENAIICFACINLFLPTVALLRLNSEQFGKVEGDFTIRMIHTLCYLGLVNIPFMVMRIFLYHFEQDVSVFLIKNMIGIFGAIRILYYEFLRRRVKRGTAAAAVNGNNKAGGSNTHTGVNAGRVTAGKLDALSEDAEALLYSGQLPGRKTYSFVELPSWCRDAEFPYLAAPQSAVASGAGEGGELLEMKTEAPAAPPPPPCDSMYLTPDAAALAAGGDKPGPPPSTSVADIVAELIREKKRGVDVKEKVRRTMMAEKVREKSRQLRSGKVAAGEEFRPRTKTM